jgi:hypothetical protein
MGKYTDECFCACGRVGGISCMCHDTLRLLNVQVSLPVVAAAADALFAIVDPASI